MNLLAVSSLGGGVPARRSFGRLLIVENGPGCMLPIPKSLVGGRNEIASRELSTGDTLSGRSDMNATSGGVLAISVQNPHITLGWQTKQPGSLTSPYQEAGLGCHEVD